MTVTATDSDLPAQLEGGSVFFAGDVGVLPAGTTAGILEVRLDLNDEDNMSNGGIVLGVASGDPSVQFGTAEIFGNWTLKSATTSADGSQVDFSTSSILTDALGPRGGQNVLFATIPYTLSGAGAPFTFVVGPEALVDGKNFGTDVTPDYTFVDNNDFRYSDILTLRWSGSGKFTITSGGVLSFLTAPDFEAPVDLDGDNTYEVTVQVDDGEGGTATQSISVTVTPENDNDPDLHFSPAR